MADNSDNFRQELLKLGIISYREQDTLLSIAKRCAATIGVPMGAAGALMGMKAGTVVVPGVGTLSGSLVGFLAGLSAGTMMCTAANMTHRKEMRRLLDN